MKGLIYLFLTIFLFANFAQAKVGSVYKLKGEINADSRKLKPAEQIELIKIEKPKPNTVGHVLYYFKSKEKDGVSVHVGAVDEASAEKWVLENLISEGL